MCGILAVGSLGTGDQRWRWARVALPRGQAQRRVVEEEKRNRRRRKNRDGARQKEQNRNIGILMQWWWCIGILMQCGFEQWEPFCSPGGKCLAFCILHAFVICCDTVSSVSHQYHVLAQLINYFVSTPPWWWWVVCEGVCIICAEVAIIIYCN